MEGLLQKTRKETIEFMDLEPILERAKLHLNVKSDAELARHLGISRQELHQYKKKSSIPYKYLINFCRIESLSTDWLIFGREKPSDSESEYKEKYIKKLEAENKRYEIIFNSLLTGDMNLSDLNKLHGAEEVRKLV